MPAHEGASSSLLRASSRLERMPSNVLERIPEHAAALEATLNPQDLLTGKVHPSTCQWSKQACSSIF
jgi:hypothetical protein